MNFEEKQASFAFAGSRVSGRVENQQCLSFCQLSPRHGRVKLPTRGMRHNFSSRLNAAFPKHCLSQMPPFPRGSIPHRAGPWLGVDGFLLSQAITEPEVQNQLQSTLAHFLLNSSALVTLVRLF